MLLSDLLDVFDSDHAVTTVLSTGSWDNVDGRCEYESYLRVEAILHEFAEVTIAQKSDLCLLLAQEALHTRRCDFEGLLIVWERLVDGFVVSFNGSLNKE